MVAIQQVLLNLHQPFHGIKFPIWVDIPYPLSQEF